MLQRTIKYIIGFLGFIVGFGLSIILKRILVSKICFNGWRGLSIQVVISFIIGLTFYLYSQKIIDRWRKYIGLLESKIEKIPLNEILLGSFGLILGLVIANLLSKPLIYIDIPYIAFVLQIILYGGLGCLGIKAMARKKEDIFSLEENLKAYKKSESKYYDKDSSNSIPKILDTGAIIDGRILDICKTGIIEGPLIIADFVLEELQSIADSTEDLKRNKGRRGLDILNEIQKGKIKELGIEVIISYEKFVGIEATDSKLLELARLLKGKIITTDYNLNKIAEIHGINVLSINELANALKPIVFPGEVIEAYVAKDGKEKGQGLAYLDDGTMIVIESGGNFIGETIGITVTSALQTSAGKMIFAKPRMIAE